MIAFSHLLLALPTHQPSDPSKWAPVRPDPKWAPLREQLDGWVLNSNFAVMVGDNSGPLFHYVHGNFSMRTKVETASTSKWPLAMMFVGLVADGTIRSLDAKAHEYVPWWTKDPLHPKSHITLRHLLSFTSGFGDGTPGQENGNKSCMDADAEYYPCAEEVYRTTKLNGLPGQTYTYNSIHLQLAGAVAMAASGLRIQEVISKYLLEPYGMVDSSCALPTRSNPQLAVCLETTGLDYGECCCNRDLRSTDIANRHAHRQTHTCTHAHKRARAHAHKHTNTHASTHTRSLTHSHTLERERPVPSPLTHPSSRFAHRAISAPDVEPLGAAQKSGGGVRGRRDALPLQGLHPLRQLRLRPLPRVLRLGRWLHQRLPRRRDTRRPRRVRTPHLPWSLCPPRCASVSVSLCIWI